MTNNASGFSLVPALVSRRPLLHRALVGRGFFWLQLSRLGKSPAAHLGSPASSTREEELDFSTGQEAPRHAGAVVLCKPRRARRVLRLPASRRAAPGLAPGEGIAGSAVPRPPLGVDELGPEPFAIPGPPVIRLDAGEG